MKSNNKRPRAKRVVGNPIHGSNGYCIGVVTPEGVLVRQAKPEHILRTPPAIATDFDGLVKAQKYGANALRVEVSDGRVFEADLQTGWQYGFVIDRGWGRQQACPLNRFKVTVREGGAR